ncbi:MAG: hypothetical protein M5U16_09405 [Hyphomicrobium sp.]|nr:hypothetical protein [Hyphomicrobium sp.]
MRTLIFAIVLMLGAGPASAQGSLRELEELHVNLRENLKQLNADKQKLQEEKFAADGYLDILTSVPGDPNDPDILAARRNIARINDELSKVQDEIDYLDREQTKVVDQMNQAAQAGGSTGPQPGTGGTSSPGGTRGGTAGGGGGAYGPRRDGPIDCLYGQC